jgi:hypothetical protein
MCGTTISGELWTSEEMQKQPLLIRTYHSELDYLLCGHISVPLNRFTGRPRGCVIQRLRALRFVSKVIART